MPQSGLEALIGAARFAAFLEHFRAKTRFHAGDPAGFPDLLPWPTINRLIEQDNFDERRFRVLRNGVDIPRRMYRAEDGEGRIRSGALQQLLRGGASLINEIDRCSPEIERVAALFERRLGVRVWTNCYLSFTAGGAFAAHFDPHDVLVLQLHGRKRWHSHGAPAPYPVATVARSSLVPPPAVWSAILEAGDILFLPRGEIHSTGVEGGHSVHLTIGLETRRGVDFVAWIARQAVEQERFRLDLPSRDEPAAVLARQEELRALLHAMIDAASLAAFLAEDAGARELRSRVTLDLPGAIDEALAPTVILDPALRRSLDMPTLAAAGTAVPVGGEKFQLNQTERQLLAVLSARGPLTLAALAAECGIADLAVASAAAITLAQAGLVGLRDGEAVGR